MEIDGKEVTEVYIRHNGQWLELPLKTLLDAMNMLSNEVAYQEELDGRYDITDRDHVDPHGYISVMSLLGRIFGWTVAAATLGFAIFLVLTHKGSGLC